MQFAGSDEEHFMSFYDQKLNGIIEGDVLKMYAKSGIVVPGKSLLLWFSKTESVNKIEFDNKYVEKQGDLYKLSNCKEPCTLEGINFYSWYGLWEIVRGSLKMVSNNIRKAVKCLDRDYFQWRKCFSSNYSCHYSREKGVIGVVYSKDFYMGDDLINDFIPDRIKEDEKSFLSIEPFIIETDSFLCVLSPDSISSVFYEYKETNYITANIETKYKTVLYSRSAADEIIDLQIAKSLSDGRFSLDGYSDILNRYGVDINQDRDTIVKELNVKIANSLLLEEG